MDIKNSMLNQPINAVVFDCDGTLSRLEGIDVLAQQNHVGEQVRELTEHAMSHDGLNCELYQHRLSLVKPSLQQIEALGDDYYKERVADLDRTLTILKSLNKDIYVVSAGVNPAVAIFAQKLGIDIQHVYGVDLVFNSNGDYQDFGREAPCAQAGGKRIIIEEIKQHHPRVLHIGDGMNDFQVKDLVTRFVGYGGVVYRDKIAKACEFYLHDESMAQLLPLAMTETEFQSLDESDRQFIISHAPLKTA